MADKSKQPQAGRSTDPTSASPKRSESSAAPAPPRRVAAHKLREERQQRLVLITTGVAIGVALLIVVGGLLYEQLWLPSRPVARVGTTTLNQGAYWLERRHAYANEIIQNFQLLALFNGNPQFTQQFEGQSPQINQQVKNIRSSPLDETVVSNWELRELKSQGSATRGISLSADQINQALAQDLGPLFIPAPPAETPTPDPAAPTSDPASGTISETGAPLASPTLAPTELPTPADGPTATPLPTSTPLPTPAPAEASSQVDQLVDEIFRRYELELAVSGASATLTRDDFRAALNDQYREQVIDRELQAQLVPEAGFSFSQEPERVTARQILLAVNPPAGADQTASDTAFAEALPRAEALVADLRGGADFATLAAENSDDPGSREQGGSLGSFDRDGLADSGVTYPPELVSTAFSLSEGLISDPIRTSFGWHVLEVTLREIPSTEDQLREARTKALDDWVAEQRTALGVARFPEPTPTATLPPTTPTPTSVPTFQPGPPTALPTPTELPTEAVPTTPANSPEAPPATLEASPLPATPEAEASPLPATPEASPLPATPEAEASPLPATPEAATATP